MPAIANGAGAWTMISSMLSPGRSTKKSPTRARSPSWAEAMGGYATLVGLTRNPEIYACGIDIVGPSNLETLIRAIPPYWEAFRSQNTEEGLRLLRERSPPCHGCR